MKRYVEVLIGSSESREKAEEILRRMAKEHGVQRPPQAAVELRTGFAGEKAWVASCLLPCGEEGSALPVRS